MTIRRSSTYLMSKCSLVTYGRAGFLALAGVAGAIALLGFEPRAEALEPLAAYVAASHVTSPDVREAGSAAVQRRHELDAAWGRLLPAFTARGSYTRNQYAAELTVPGGPGAAPTTVTITPQDQLDATLALEVPLVDVAAWERIGASRDTSDAATLRARATALDVERLVVRDYYQLVAGAALVDAGVRTRDAAAQNLDVVRQRRDAGVASDLDVDRASAEVERARQTIADAEYLRVVAARALESASGRAAGVVAPGDYPADDLREEAPLAAWEAAVGAGAVPSVAAAAAEERAADRNRHAARAALLPTISATAQERLTNATGFSGHVASWAVGATASWRLDVPTVEAAKGQDAAADAARARADKARITARDRVHDDWQLVRSDTAKARAARAQEDAAAHAARIAHDRYAGGTATQLDLVQAQRDAFSASASRIQADCDLAYARAALRLDASRPLEGGRR